MPPRRGGIVGCPAVAGGAQLLGEPAGAFGGVQEARDLLVGEFGGDLGTPIARRRARGVEWVRPTDLIARHSASLSGRGIDFEAELARRARAPIANRMHDLADRARRLPPLSAFGRSGATHESPVRSGVGMNR